MVSAKHAIEQIKLAEMLLRGCKEKADAIDSLDEQLAAKRERVLYRWLYIALMAPVAVAFVWAYCARPDQ